MCREAADVQVPDTAAIVAMSGVDIRVASLEDMLPVDARTDWAAAAPTSRRRGRLWMGCAQLVHNLMILSPHTHTQ